MSPGRPAHPGRLTRPPPPAMPRIPDSEIDRIKSETDLVALIRSRGIELKKHGANAIRCHSGHAIRCHSGQAFSQQKVGGNKRFACGESVRPRIGSIPTVRDCPEAVVVAAPVARCGRATAVRRTSLDALRLVELRWSAAPLRSASGFAVAAPVTRAPAARASRAGCARPPTSPGRSCALRPPGAGRSGCG